MDRLNVLRNVALVAGVAAGLGAAHGAARAAPRARAAFAAAAAADTGADGAGVTQKMIDAGKAVFHGAGGCFACHGMNMQGSAIAPPLDKKGQPWKAAKGGTYDAIVNVIDHGVAGTAMIARPNGISPAAVKQVAAYVWAVNHGKAKP